MEKATFAAGCFWGVEAYFRSVPGVIDVVCGYTGGDTENPTYKDVCTGETGHAEAVEVTFDPAVIRYDELLVAFFDGHNPTQLDAQGADVGTQYRSFIFYHTPEQKRAANDMITGFFVEETYAQPVVTGVAAAGPFWRAEEYHQRYFEKHPDKAACHAPYKKR